MKSQSNTAEPMIYAGALNGINALVRDLEVGDGRVLQTESLSSRRQPPRDSFVPLRDYEEALARGADQARVNNFALVFGNRFDPLNLGPLGYAFSHAKTLREALTLFCENFQLIQDDTSITIETHSDLAMLKYAVEVGDPYEFEVDAEASIGILHGMCRRAIGAKWQAQKMTFVHGQFEPNSLIKEVFGISPQFGAQANSLCFDRRFLDQPIQAHDPYLFRLLLNDIDQSLSEKTRRRGIAGRTLVHIERHIADQAEFDQRRIAAALGMSSRSLSDTLRENGASYRKLVMQARVAQAKRLLQSTDLPINQIAFQVGFSEASALTRAFRQQGEETPKSVQRKRDTSH